MAKRIALAYDEALQNIVEKYRESGQKWPATTRVIARWGYRNRLWEPQEKDIVGQLASDLGRALRKEYYTDPQGRRVRTKHAARRVEDDLSEDSSDREMAPRTLWHDIRIDDPDYIIKAFQQRRMQIVGACKQLKTDGDSFNDNHPSGKKIQLIFNFEEDLADLDQSTEYLPPKPSSN